MSADQVAVCKQLLAPVTSRRCGVRQSNEQGRLEAELFPLRMQLNRGAADMSHASCATSTQFSKCRAAQATLL